MQTLPPTESASGIGPATLAEAGIAALQELEASLLASVRAVLGRDLCALDLATRDQLRLRRALEILWAWNGTVSRTNDRASEFTLPTNIECNAGLRAAQLRVLHLGRVQAALLRREQRWINVLANLVAGPEANYVRPPIAAPLMGIAGR
jgi:hypothetical protein